MSTHPLRFAALAAALLALGVSLSAQGRGPGFGPGRGFAAGEGPGMKGLNLTEDQKTNLKAIHDSHQGALKAKLDAARAARQALREAMTQAATDAKTLQALHEKAAAAQFDVMLEHRALRQEILPLLTAEQKTRFEQGPMGMGPRGGRGMGPKFGSRHEGMGSRPGGMGPGYPQGQPS